VRWTFGWPMARAYLRALESGDWDYLWALMDFRWEVRRIEGVL
jgi:hypothetical protein